MSAGARMAAEMGQQPDVLAALAARRRDLVARVRAVLPERPAGVALLARGSSDHAAVFGRYVLEQASGRPVALAAPSLSTLYGVKTDYRSWVVVAVSQSGRTPEIVTVLDQMRAAGACTVAVTNEAGSPLAHAADAMLDLDAGDELAVPATKTFTAQVAAFAILAEALGPVPWEPSAWERLPAAVETVLADRDSARVAAARIGSAPGMICVARGYLYCVALEAALKLKETTSILAEGYSAADFRHGPIAVVARGLPVLTFAVEGPARDDVERLAEEIRARGGQVVAVGDSATADLSVPGDVPEPLATIPAAVRAQQLAWALALARGVDPDAPFALSKVTATT